MHDGYLYICKWGLKMGRMLSVVVFQEFSADVLLIIIEFRSLASKLEYFDHCSLCFNEESFWLKSVNNGK